MTDPRILAYLRQYGETYTDATLRSRLVAAGFAPEDIDAAFAALAAERRGDQPPAGNDEQTDRHRIRDERPPAEPYWQGTSWQGRGGPPNGWPPGAGQSDPGSGDMQTALAFFGYLGIQVLLLFTGLWPLSAVLFIAAVIGWLWASSTGRRDLARGLGWGLIFYPIGPFVFFLLLLLLLWGICVVSGYKLTFG